MPLRRGFGWECAGPGQLWEVVGDGKTGGVPVQINQDPSSRPTPSLLANGSIVEQLALLKDVRLQYRLISGTGPKQGWLSLANADGTETLSRCNSTAIASTKGTGVLNKRPEHEGLQLLATEHHQVWDVIRDGVLVSVSQNERSASADVSLRKGARLTQLRRDGNRLHFHKLEGDGPADGWLSILKAGVRQAILVDDEADVVELQVKIKHRPSSDVKTEEKSLQVSIPQGVVQGHIVRTWNRPLVVFHDIPIATFTQRFAIADGPYPWAGTRDGMRMSTVCPQEETTGRVIWMGDVLIDSRRDSSERGHLCVAVQRPLHGLAEGGDKKRLLPVEVHFHGGLGWGFAHQISSSVFAVASDIVNVDLYFRTGPLASFAHPDLSAENGGCSGAWRNYDCMECLLWIKKSISKFGGDPDKVLAYAISGGNAYLMQTLSHPLSKGLVKACYLAGPPGDWLLRRSTKTGRGDANPASSNWIYRASAEEIGLYTQKELLNCKSLAEVRALPIAEFLEAFYAHPDAIPLMTHVVDGDFLRGPLHEYVEKGLWPHPDMPIAMEFATHEGNIYCEDKQITTPLGEFPIQGWTWDEFAIVVGKHVGRGTPHVLKTYAHADYDGARARWQGQDLFNLACKFVGDLQCTEVSMPFAKGLAAQGVPTYFIEWQWTAEKDVSSLVPHGLQAIFSHPSDAAPPLWEDKSFEVSALARGMLIELIETGSPGWPELTSDMKSFAFMSPQGTLEVNLPGQREALLERWKAVAPVTEKVREEDMKTFGFSACATWRSDLLDRPYSMLPAFMDDDYDVGNHV